MTSAKETTCRELFENVYAEQRFRRQLDAPVSYWLRNILATSHKGESSERRGRGRHPRHPHAPKATHLGCWRMQWELSREQRCKMRAVSLRTSVPKLTQLFSQTARQNPGRSRGFRRSVEASSGVRYRIPGPLEEVKTIDDLEQEEQDRGADKAVRLVQVWLRRLRRPALLVRLRCRG